MAEKAGITKAMLSAYECGRQLLSLATLGNILVSLDCRLGELDKPHGRYPRRHTRAGGQARSTPPAG